MTNQYTYGESYYFFISEELINTELPNAICEDYGLKLGTLLGATIWNIFELKDGRKVATIQLNVGVDRALNDVTDYISKVDFDNALNYYSNYGIIEFMVQSEFDKLERKIDEY